MQTTIRSLLLLGLIALLAACSSGATTPAPASVAPTSSAPSVAPSEAPSDAPSQAPASAAAEATIELATNPLGEIIVDAEGMTLYAFTPDTAGESTCYDD
jgi:predicted lipoprotein with Yx(FWY)xxD motif